MGKRKDSEAGVEFGGNASRLTPVDVQQQQFRRSFRGYDEQEVDDFLDRVTEELTTLLDEKGALQEGRGASVAPTHDPGQVADATRAADDIKRNARDQAEVIVRDARARAAAVVRDAETRAAAIGSDAATAAAAAAGGAAAGGATAGLSAFVTREREFLQRLASLVQGHAEGVKEMVQTARRSQASAASTPAPATSAPPQAEPVHEPEAAIVPEPEGFGTPVEPERPTWRQEGGPAVDAARPEPASAGDAVLRVPEAEAERPEAAGEPRVEEAAAVGPPAPDADAAAGFIDEPDTAPASKSPRWSSAQPPRLPDLPTPPAEPARQAGDRAPVGDGAAVEEPVAVSRTAARRGLSDDDETDEGEREATLRELFWGED